MDAQARRAPTRCELRGEIRLAEQCSGHRHELEAVCHRCLDRVEAIDAAEKDQRHVERIAKLSGEREKERLLERELREDATAHEPQAETDHPRLCRDELFHGNVAAEEVHAVEERTTTGEFERVEMPVAFQEPGDFEAFDEPQTVGDPVGHVELGGDGTVGPDGRSHGGDDCYDALVWLAARPEVDPSRIVIAGASAGAGLTAGLALLARDRGGASPALQVLVYPMLDDRTALRTDIDERNFRLWTNRSNRYGWSSYLGAPPGSADVSPHAAPARASDEQLAGLPPAWIGVGTLDLFHDEDVLYAQRLRAAGVECELYVVDGAFHGFDGMTSRASVTRAFNESRDSAIASALSS